jgi:hypothetical protein
MSAATIDGCLTGTWHWVFHPHDRTQRLRDVGVLKDGALHNPNAYDETLVREAIRQATSDLHQRRSERSKKAAATRRERHEKRVHEIAQRLVDVENRGRRCACCGKRIWDTESVARGIGSECWQSVLDAIAASREKAQLSLN